MRGVVAFAVLAVLVLGLDAYLGPSRPDDQVAQQQESYAAHGLLPVDPDVCAGHIAGHSGKKAQSGHHSGSGPAADDAVALFTLALVIVGGLQWRTMRAQQATLAEQVALTRALERPWVMPTGEGELSCNPAPSDAMVDFGQPSPPGLKIVVANSGKGPALNVVPLRAGWEVLWEDDPLPETLHYPAAIPGEDRGGIGVLVPNAQFTWHTNFRPAGVKAEGSELFQAFKAGASGLRLYMYGEFMYRDSLNRGEEYFTEWCLYAKEPNAQTLYMVRAHNTAR